MLGLFFHLGIHAALSLISGVIVWRMWKKPIMAFGGALAGGVLIDLDHLIDYFFAFGFDFRIDYFLRGYAFLKNDAIYVLFHGWEYGILLLVMVLFVKNKTTKSALLALVIGLFSHLLTDVNLNNMTFRSYSVIYRAANNFNLRNIEKTHILENDSIIIK